MTYFRIHSRNDRGEYCGDWLVIESNADRATEKFFRSYPAHKVCRVTVEEFDPGKDKNSYEYYKVVKECGCLF